MRKKIKIFIVLIVVLACWIKIDITVCYLSEFRSKNKFIFSNVIASPILEPTNFLKQKSTLFAYQIKFINPHRFFVRFFDEKREYTNIKLLSIELFDKNKNWVQKLDILDKNQGSHDFVCNENTNGVNIAYFRALAADDKNKKTNHIPNIEIPSNIDEIFSHIVVRLISKNKSSDHDITIPLKRSKEREYHSKLFASLLR